MPSRCAAGLPSQENATARIPGTHVARYRPQSPGFINHPAHGRSPDPTSTVPCPRVHGRAVVWRRHGAVSDDHRATPFGSIECARRRKHGWRDVGRSAFEKYESNVGDAGFERRDQNILGWIALRRRWARRHRRVRGLRDHRNPCAGIPCIRRAEAREHPDRRWQPTQCLGGSRKMAGRHHDAAANQRTARERPQLHGPPGIVDTPDHDRANVGVAIVAVDGRLSRRRHRSEQECKHPGERRRHRSGCALHVTIAACASPR